LPDATPLTLSGSDTLFTITILPTESSNLSEILSIADDLIRSEAILNDLEQTKIDLVFRFLKRTTSTQEFDKANINIYPNPTSTGSFVIQSSGVVEGKVSVFNESGQEVYVSQNEVEDGNYQISMPEGIKNGMYMVRLTNENFVTTKKIILLR
jgi:hypothetical protein